MTGEEWYREFYKRALDDKGINKSGLSTLEYTKAIGDFLKEMAESCGYTVTKERTAHGGGRLDQTWIKGQHVITIEHENELSTIDKEIDNLCDQGSQLKILITYAPDADFLPIAIETARRVERGIAHRSALQGEFLLVIAPYCEDGWAGDWAAFRSVAEIRMQPLRGKPAKREMKT